MAAQVNLKVLMQRRRGSLERRVFPDSAPNETLNSAQQNGSAGGESGTFFTCGRVEDRNGHQSSSSRPAKSAGRTRWQSSNWSSKKAPSLALDKKKKKRTNNNNSEEIRAAVNAIRPRKQALSARVQKHGPLKNVPNQDRVEALLSCFRSSAPLRPKSATVYRSSHVKVVAAAAAAATSKTSTLAKCKSERPQSAVTLLRNLSDLVRADCVIQSESEVVRNKALREKNMHAGLDRERQEIFTAANKVAHTKPGVTILEGKDQKLKVQIRLSPKRPRSGKRSSHKSDGLESDDESLQFPTSPICAW